MKELLKESGHHSPKRKNYSTDLPCIVCGGFTENGNTLHHVITRKNQGPDEDWNLMPLCTFHHNEIHSIGRTSFANKYPLAKQWFLEQGWEFVALTKKWGRNA